MHINLSEMYVDSEIKEAVNNVLDSGRFIKGEQLRLFEEEFSSYCGADHGIGVSSGTSAMLLTMMALGIGHGDEVIVPSHTFIATVSPSKFMGATPVYVDIDPCTYTLDPDKLESAITDKTKAIIVVHLYGHPGDMDRIMSVARAHNIPVIEDACQSHAAEYKGKKTGCLGDMAIFSFFPSKNMTVGGDGGMVLTSDDELARRMSMLRDHGRTDKYLHEMLGLNLRLSEIPASIGRVQLKHLDKWTDIRRKIAAKYNSLLDGLVETPVEKNWAKHSYYVYTVQTDNRDSLQEHLNKNGISTGLYYPVPVHRQPCMEAGELSLPVTDACVDRILSLPMHPQLTDENIEYVAGKIREWIR